MRSVGPPPLNEPAALRQTIKVLSKPNTARAVYHLVETWGVITLVLYGSILLYPLSSGVSGVIAYLAAVAVVASRQHALMVLSHEGIHKRLSRNVWLNDGLARYAAAFPVFISLAKWRFIHLYHHQCTQTADDPDRAIYARYPLGSRKFFGLLLRDVCGMNVLTTLKYFVDLPRITPGFNRRFLGDARAAQYRQVADMRAFTAFWLVLATGGLIFAGSHSALLFGLYWLVPYCTFTQVFFRIRGAIEHGNVPDPGNPYRQTRTYFLHPAVGFFFAPKRVNYHLEHHLYPSVPFFYLPRLHAELQKTVYPAEAAYCEAFTESLRRLVRGKGDPATNNFRRKITTEISE
jgi:fatty acid desaturase